MGNGAVIPVTGVGLVVVKTSAGRTISLKGVLLVPQLFCNLFSGNKIHSEKMEIVFPSTDSEIMTIKNDSGTLITTGRKNERGVYRMEFDKFYNYQPPQRKSKTHPGHTCAVNDSVLVSLDVWHQRLGHVALERIKRIHREKQVLGVVLTRSVGPYTSSTNTCAACAKGKMKWRNKTHGRTHPATEPYERVHADLHFSSEQLALAGSHACCHSQTSTVGKPSYIS